MQPISGGTHFDGLGGKRSHEGGSDTEVDCVPTPSSSCSQSDSSTALNGRVSSWGVKVPQAVCISKIFELWCSRERSVAQRVVIPQMLEYQKSEGLSFTIEIEKGLCHGLVLSWGAR